MNRRDALKAAGSTLLAAAISPVFGKSKSLRVLILGGTGFIGPHFVNALTAGGHKITLFNRGKRDPEASQGVEQLLGDRNDNLKSLEGRDWDVVIDNSGYTPNQVSSRRICSKRMRSTTSSSPASRSTTTSRIRPSMNHTSLPRLVICPRTSSRARITAR